MSLRPTVMKFGGTSVEDSRAFERVARIVRASARERPLVVVSAMSRVTDALFRGVRLAAGGDVGAALASLEEHFERHRTVARSLPTADFLAFDAALEGARGGIRTLLGRVAALPSGRETSPAQLPPLEDAVVSYGEQLSARLLAAVLRLHDLPARHVDARRCVVTDGAHGSANPFARETERATRAELTPLLEAGMVPVLGGFIAVSREGATTTLGRGGSDFSAALFGAALAAREIQIWTDVTGVLTADPRVVPGARTVPDLSYREAAELAYFGAKVLHPKTVQPAGERGIPVRVCNSRRPDEAGTLIRAQARHAPPAVKAIAHRTGVTTLQVTAARGEGLEGFWRTVSGVSERHRAVLDVLTTSEACATISFDGGAEREAVGRELGRLGAVEFAERRAIICVVGEGLRTTAGVVTRAFDALGDFQLHALRLSGVNLTFVVDESQAARAVARLHETFFGEPGLRPAAAALRESFQPPFLRDACPEPTPL